MRLLAKHFLDKMLNLLNDTLKFEKKLCKERWNFEFGCQQEKRIENILKKLVASTSISEETRGSPKPDGARPGIMHGMCKVHKDNDNCTPFRSILSAINTCTYKISD